MIYGSRFSFILQCWLAKELVADVLKATGQAEPARLPSGQFGTHEFNLHELLPVKT